MAPYAHGFYVADKIRQRFPELNSAFYLDIWPFGTPILAVLRPEMMYQLTQATQVPKYRGLRTFIKPLTGKEDLVTMEGKVWRHWRSIFNPGFSANHICSLIPGMVEKAQVFRHLLEERATNGEMFLLEHSSLSLTVDIIGGAVM